MDLIRIGRYISLLLRHKPEAGNLTLDHNGWCPTDALVAAVARKHPGFDLPTLQEIVATNNKRRYTFNDDQSKIRANQGHSVNVDVQLPEATPPDILYHGTDPRNAPSILTRGLLKMTRLHVHLSADIETARAVARRKNPDEQLILAVDCRSMHADGHKFYLSTNTVWLTDHVPPQYLQPL